jgi:hypothetical protein
LLLKPRASLRRARPRQRDGFDLREVELFGGVIDAETDDVAFGVEVDDEPWLISRASAPGVLASSIVRLSVSG